MNGNEALALGALASGMELCAMYPITPATSVSHFLADVFEKFGGVLHQAEDEIAAAGVAIGASYAGKVAFTVTSGPGLALKTEFIGLAIMTETPLVVIDVQRGGPSTGLPDESRAIGPARRALRAAGRRAAHRHRAGDDRRVLPLGDHRAPPRRGVPHGRHRAERRESRDRRAAVPAPDAPCRMAGEPSRISRRSHGNSRPYDWDPRLGTSTRDHSGPAGRDVHRHRPVARRAQQGGVRLRRASARLGDAQPQARRASANAHAARRSTATPTAAIC